MSKTESNIGTVLQTDLVKYNQEVGTWEKEIFPTLNEVILFYNSFNIGPFTDETLKQLIANSFDEIEDNLYNKNSENVASDVLAEIVRSSTKESIKKLKTKWLNIASEFDRIYTKQISNIALEWDNVFISDSVPGINKQNLFKKYSISIETEVEANAYELIQDLKNSYDKLLEFARENGYQYDIIDANGEALLYINSNYDIVVNKEAVKYFNK